jgi:hypothetical protein
MNFVKMLAPVYMSILVKVTIYGVKSSHSVVLVMLIEHLPSNNFD